MAEHHARIEWTLKDGEDFSRGRYSRGHRWGFDGGVTVSASASPHVVPLPWSVEAAVDPEEAFVAAIASCHMLWFLSIAARHRLVVVEYRDDAVAVMEKNAAGKMAVTKATLRPHVVFAKGAAITPETHAHLHHLAHEECFIASSVLTEIACEPTMAESPN